MGTGEADTGPRRGLPGVSVVPGFLVCVHVHGCRHRPEPRPQKRPKTRPMLPAHFVARLVHKTAPPKGALREQLRGQEEPGRDTSSGEWGSAQVNSSGAMARTEPQQAPCGERCSGRTPG